MSGQHAKTRTMRREPGILTEFYRHYFRIVSMGVGADNNLPPTVMNNIISKILLLSGLTFK